MVFVKNDTSQRTLFPKRDWSEAGEQCLRSEGKRKEKRGRGKQGKRREKYLDGRRTP